MSGTGSDLGRALDALIRVLRSAEVADFALTGGVAFSYWVEPRYTKDIDVAGTLTEAGADRLLALHDGMRVGPERVPDVVRFRVDDWDVDLFVAKGGHSQSALDRAVDVEFDGVRIKVVTKEDLVLHKFLKLRTDRSRVLQDLADLRALAEPDPDPAPLERSYIDSWLQPDERRLLDALATEDDEALLRRILGT